MSLRFLNLVMRIGLSLMLAASLAGANNTRNAEILNADIHAEGAGGACLGFDDSVRRNESSRTGRRCLVQDLSFQNGSIIRLKCVAHFAVASGHLLSGHRLLNGLLAPLLT